MRTSSSGYGVHPSTSSDTIAFWPLDEGSGTTATDIFGSRSLSNAAALWGNGMIGKALNFSVSSVATSGGAGTDAAALQAQWSCEVWFKIASAPASQATLIEYSNPAATGAANNIQMAIELNANLSLSWRWEGGAVVTQATTAKARAGVWQHVAVVKQDNGAGAFTVTTYLNGVADNVQAAVAAPTGGSNGQWHLGGGHAQFVGSICSVHVSDAAFDSTHCVQSWRRGMLWRTPANTGHGIDDLDVVIFPSWAGGTGYSLRGYLRGYDFLRQVQIQESVDQQCMTAEISLKREVYEISLSPLMETSMANQNPQPSIGVPGPASSTFAALLHIGAMMVVYARRQSAGSDVVASAGDIIFQGSVDTINSGGDFISIGLRDEGALLVDTYIESEAEYNVGADASIEATIQAILTASGIGVSLYTPTSPSFNLGEFKQRRENLLQASQTLADQIGWLTRYRFDPLTSSYRFTLYDIERSRTRFDGVIAVSDYSQFGGISQSIQNVRNAVRVCYRDSLGEASGVDDNGNPIFPPANVVVTDPASITAYGRRFMEISDAACPNIDTSAEATAMATAILNDLSTPQLTVDIDVPYWEIELGDRLKFEENNRAFDTPQTFAVIGRSVTFADGRGSTSLQLKETPASGLNKHLVKEAGPGRSLPPVTDVRDAPTDFGVRGRYAPLELLVQDADLLQNAGSLAGVQNPGYLVHPRGIHGVPTGWNHGSGTWGSGGDVYFTGTSNSGDRAITLLTVGATVTSRWMPVIGGRVYEGRVVWTGAGATDQLECTVEYYNAGRTLTAGHVIFNDVVSVPTDWQTSRGIAAAATADRWARIKLVKKAGPPISVDRVSIGVIPESFEAILNPAVAVGAGTHSVVFNTEIYDYGGHYDHGSGQFLVYEPGFHEFHAYVGFNASVTNSNVGMVLNMQIDIPGVGVSTAFTTSFTPGSGVTFADLWLHTPPVELVAGTKVTFELIVPAAGSITGGQVQGGRIVNLDR